MIVLVQVKISLSQEPDNFPSEILARTLRACISKALGDSSQVFTEVEIIEGVKQDHATVKVTSESQDSDCFFESVKMAMKPFLPNAKIVVFAITVAQIRYRSF